MNSIDRNIIFTNVTSICLMLFVLSACTSGFDKIIGATVSIDDFKNDLTGTWYASGEGEFIIFTIASLEGGKYRLYGYDNEKSFSATFTPRKIGDNYIANINVGLINYNYFSKNNKPNYANRIDAYYYVLYELLDSNEINLWIVDIEAVRDDLNLKRFSGDLSSGCSCLAWTRRTDAAKKDSKCDGSLCIVKIDDVDLFEKYIASNIRRLFKNKDAITFKRIQMKIN